MWKLNVRSTCLALVCCIVLSHGIAQVRAASIKTFDVDSTASSITDPASTASFTTEPPSTASPTTKPPSTASSTTEPPLTGSSTTEPPSTASSTTKPPSETSSTSGTLTTTSSTRVSSPTSAATSTANNGDGTSTSTESPAISTAESSTTEPVTPKEPEIIGKMILNDVTNDTFYETGLDKKFKIAIAKASNAYCESNKELCDDYPYPTTTLEPETTKITTVEGTAATGTTTTSTAGTSSSTTPTPATGSSTTPTAATSSSTTPTAATGTSTTSTVATATSTSPTEATGPSTSSTTNADASATPTDGTDTSTTTTAATGTPNNPTASNTGATETDTSVASSSAVKAEEAGDIALFADDSTASSPASAETSSVADVVTTSKQLEDDGYVNSSHVVIDSTTETSEYATTNLEVLYRIMNPLNKSAVYLSAQDTFNAAQQSKKLIEDILGKTVNILPGTDATSTPPATTTTSGPNTTVAPRGLEPWAIALIVIGSVAAAALIGVAIYFLCIKKKREDEYTNVRNRDSVEPVYQSPPTNPPTTSSSYQYDNAAYSSAGEEMRQRHVEKPVNTQQQAEIGLSTQL